MSDAEAQEALAQAWEAGYKTGYSYRGPHGAAAGNPVPPNPFRAQAESAEVPSERGGA